MIERPKLSSELALEAATLINKEAFWDNRFVENGFYFLIDKDDDVFYILEKLTGDGFDAWYNGQGRLIVRLKVLNIYFSK